jgi:ABC-2 type transport system permease protein
MTTLALGRSHSPTARRTGGPLSLLAGQVVAELKQNLRAPEYVVGVVTVPVILFAMFGLSNSGETMPSGTNVATILIGSFSAYGVVSLCIFTFGIDVAQERRRGWLRRLRATPMPMWAYFVGKIAMALAFTLVIMALIVGAAVAARVPVDAVALLRTTGVLLLGTVAFAPLGFALAFLASPKAASAIGNLIFLPLSFCSGFFMSLRTLPQFLQDLAPYLPTYHFGRLVWAQVAPADDITLLTGRAPSDLGVHLAWVAGAFVVFTALAAVGYVRDGHRERS